MNVAIHSVFILKENILFLEEWIKYHTVLGFNKFYLYDNSKINRMEDNYKKRARMMIPGKINKYNVNYGQLVNMDEKQMTDYVEKLCDKYNCIQITEWSPTDENGNVLFNQKEAHNDCLAILKKDNIDWCANIDMDEYIVIKNYDNIAEYLSSLPSNIKNVRLSQIKFDNRFNNIGGLVTDIKKSSGYRFPIAMNNKNIYSVKETIYTTVHKITIEPGYEQILARLSDIWFNHYHMNLGFRGEVDNINKNIKAQLDTHTFIPFS